MNEDRISQALVRYGTQLSQWPWWMRCQVRRSWLGTPAARARLKQELALQRLLQDQIGATHADALPAELLQRLDAIPAQFVQQPAARSGARFEHRSSERRLIALGAGWALACSVVGVSVGATGWIAPAAEADALVDYAWGMDAPALLWEGGEAS